MADEDLDLDSGDGGNAPKSSKKMLIIIIIGVLLLVTVAVLGTLFATGVFDDSSEQTESSENAEAVDADPDSEESVGSEKPEDVSYWPLEPPFVLNFEGKSKAKYMQIGMEVATISDKAQAAVQKHMPVIRNEVVLLLSGQKYEEMVTPDGKEQLRAELIETINKILKQHNVRIGIHKIYFTSFVMQ
jgi:flagellar protein FliL